MRHPNTEPLRLPLQVATQDARGYSARLLGTAWTAADALRIVDGVRRTGDVDVLTNGVRITDADGRHALLEVNAQSGAAELVAYGPDTDDVTGPARVVLLLAPHRGAKG